MTDSADLPLSDADRRRLGPHVATHAASSGMHKANMIAASIFAVLLTAACLAMLVFAAKSREPLGFLITAGVLFAVALLPTVSLFFLIRRLSWCLYLFKHGLVIDKNGRLEVVVWDDVHYLFEQEVIVYGVRERLVRFRLQNERLIGIDSTFRDHREMSAAVRAGVSAAVLTRAATHLKKDEEVEFGSLRLSRRGLHDGDREIAWEDVAVVRVAPSGNGYAIQVVQDGDTTWYSRAYTRFPNAEAFLHLAGEFAEVER